jgi:response regulator NasT
VNESLRIAVADDELTMREYLEDVLTRLNHTVVGLASNGLELIELARTQSPDLIITDIRMAEMDGIEAAVEICRERAVPVILVSAYHDPELIERAGASHVMAYLVKPIRSENLSPAIAIAMCRFSQFQALVTEAADLRQALEDRKVIERAKGVLMKQTGLDEDGAFRRLQKLASEKNLKLVAIARMLLTAEEAFKPSRER